MFRMMITGFLLALLCGCVAMDHSALWKGIPARPLLQPQEWADAGRTLQESGFCRFLIEDGMLYVAAEFDDAVIAAAGEKDGDDLYHGDCCEIFIKPAGQPFYWEMWISPVGLRSVVKWRKKDDLESQGHLVEGREIQVLTSTVEGSGWALEAAIPLPNVPGLAQGAWDILIARQNYDASRSKGTRELSSFPTLLESSFHRTQDYFKLRP